MALSGDAGAVRRFVLGALRLAGSSYTEPDGEMVLAACQVTRPGGLFRTPQIVQEDLQLVFTAEGAGRHPAAELVCPGSYRLQWFISGVRARGFKTRQIYADDLHARRLEKEILALLPPPMPRLSFLKQRWSLVPFLLAVFRISAFAEERREELLPLALNLVDGIYRPGLPERLRRASFMPARDYQRIERRRLTWREAWRSLQAQVGTRIASYGTDWYEQAHARLTEEGEQLRQFYQEMMADAADPEAVHAEYRRRLDELEEKYSPAIRVSLSNLALLYLPVIVYAVAAADGTPLPPLRYEPAAGIVSWESST